MPMQIEFKDDYKEVSTYTGFVNKKYKFTVKVHFNSQDRIFIPKDVEFTDDMSVNFDKQKAIKRIKSLVKEWYYLEK